ncbi:Exostosin, GT47 domain [Dillenia turbinata]|uniref:Exostosin, GT47 domain n=1 Tax=Dillenia turbinata TaxID=194707 RepID=A0AAN8Z9K8_9MAGN
MDHKFAITCQVETRRLLLIMGGAFALILIVQYVELPYGVLSSLFPIGNSLPPPDKIRSSHGDSTLKTDSVVNETILITPNTSVANGIQGVAVDWGPSDTEEQQKQRSESKEQHGGMENDQVSGDNEVPNNSTASDEDGIPFDESSPEHIEELNLNFTANATQNSDDGSMQEKVTEQQNVFSSQNETMDNSDDGSMQKKATEQENVLTSETVTADNTSSPAKVGDDDRDLTAARNGSSDVDAKSPLASSPNVPEFSSSNATIAGNLDTNSLSPPVTSPSTNTSENVAETLPKAVQADDVPNNSSIGSIENSELDPAHVLSISEMDHWLTKNQISSHSKKPHWSSSADKELLYAKLQIRSAPNIEKDPMLYAPLYRNLSMFVRSYQLMEKMLRVYIYREGSKPIFHQPILKGIYASEGWFMKLMETNKHFVTKNPRKAHLFYLPFSTRALEETLYVPNSHNRKNLIKYLKDYLDVITAKYPYWNRTDGADHFLVACHDWAPSETRKIMVNCIRAMCNADVRETFKFGKDVSLPETNIRLPRNPLRYLGGNPPSNRPYLAFFAGKMHGYLRPILLEYWGNKDPAIKVFDRLPRVKGSMNYINFMKSSKYCICPRGFEVNSPRIVEAIFYDCVPVIISDNFVPPFFNVLNWESFAVFIKEKDIPSLKDILLSIPEKRYLQMQMRVKKVQHHFLWHQRPVKYDIFHMILHSVWLNRVLQVNPR